MIVTVLPPLHRTARYRMMKVYAATETLRPTFGAGRPVDRPGDHWMIEVEAPAMKAGCGLEFMADIVQGRTTRLLIPQPGIDTGAVGLPVVDGEDLAGETLPVRGLTPYFAVRKGWFLSIITDGSRFAYQVQAEIVADEAGEAILPIWPMLMVPHEDGDTIELSEPWIEGPVIEGGAFDVGGRAVTPGAFSIEQGF